MMYRNPMLARLLPTVAPGLVIVLLTAGTGILQPVHAATQWHGLIEGETGTPGGWVQVRENSIRGTRLPMGRIADRWHTLRLGAWRDFGAVNAVHMSLSVSTIRGSTELAAPVLYNGTTIAPGRLETVTHYQDFWALRGAYWRRLVDFGQGGGLWSSVGLAYTGLTFRLHGTIAPSSVGHETKEDFITQELPVPTLGVHLRYPLGRRVRLIADATGGRLPRVYSLRHEGGAVTIDQAQWRAQLGLSGRFSAGWRLRVYWFDRYYRQNEQSHEDGNRIKLRSHGFGIGVAHGF